MVNKERSYVIIADIYAGEGEMSSEEIYEELLKDIKKNQYKESDIARWTIYSECGYDGDSSICAKAYRWETDTEMGSRITREEMEENRKKRSREEAQKLLQQQEYNQYLELKKKYDGTDRNKV